MYHITYSTQNTSINKISKTQKTHHATYTIHSLLYSKGKTVYNKVHRYDTAQIKQQITQNI